MSRAADHSVAATSSTLSSKQLAELQQTISIYSPLQLAWASGYLAAKSENGSPDTSTVAAVSVSPELTILYGSQTGNAKAIGQQVFAAAQQLGLTVTLTNMTEFKPKSLKSESYVLIVVSTHGEGEPPDDAMALHEYLFSKRAAKLNDLSYAVLALGDSSYEYFCQTGKDFDERLAELGAQRLFARVDCDVDFQEAVQQWQQQTLEKLGKEFSNAINQQNLDNIVSLRPSIESTTKPYSKIQPFLATVIDNQKITGRDSNKTVHHLELDVEGSGLTYQPGDALGILPTNEPQLITRIINEFSLDAEAPVVVSEQNMTLYKALAEHKEITAINKIALVKYGAMASHGELEQLLANANSTRDYLNSMQFVDIIQQFPARLTAQQLVDLLPVLTPRLYSIASSQAEVENEVHLTVGLLSYDVNGGDIEQTEQRRVGCGSGYLIERLAVDEQVKVFIEPNPNFRLPDNPDTKVIMVGPGTGVAPFRGFLQHRDATNASGENWLFFGEQTFTQDFLYQVEWQSYVKSGLLTKLDVAFSRDQAEKIYVQHKLRQHGAQVMQWLEQGAHLYVCGDMSRMAKDVHQALVDIVVEHGQQSEEQAERYLKQLRINKRYQKDVY
ncbi:assimilatory sulfite reductase (NADPH) flavoprotein subunit [Thalassotalea maritima]|uniref:assimilatory sulfite reductase (NADPH) flavoprotein subunit n=1 Tax=Thalassotalea maritima TaxID=3242416 RepID=UPI0035287001